MSRASRTAMAGLAGALVLLLVLPSPAAAFFTQSLDVEILVDKPSYRTGDTVSATVYVIWGGTLSDAGYVDLELGVSGLWSESIPLTRESVGVYVASFVILANMTSGGLTWLDLRSDASVGALTGSAYALVLVARSPVLTDRAFLSSYEAVPGQTVNGTLEIYLDGQLSDVDNVTVYAQIGFPGGAYSGSWIDVRNVSAGIYAFSYTVPSGLNESGTVSFYANAEVSGAASYGLPDLPSLHVDVANPFLIWLHEVALVPGNAAFEVFVADPSGRPVPGASVWVTQWLIRPFPRQRPSGQATTDSGGRARFDFTMPTSYGPQSLYLRGYVARGSANQSFTGVVGPSQMPLGFDVQRDNPLDLFEPGETVLLNYTAEFDGAPYQQEPILYTVANASALIAYGRVTSDASGRFSLTFPMPSDYASIELTTQGPDGIYYGASPGFSAVKRMPVDIGTLQVGTTGHIVGHLPASEGPMLVTIAFYPSNTSAPADSYGGWDAAEELSGLGVHLDQQTVVGPTFDLSLTLPSFLPAGSYYLSILALPLNEIGPAPAPFPLRYAYAALVTVQAPPPVGALLVLATLPIVLATAAAAWVVERRRKRLPPPKRTEPQPPPPTP